MDQIQPNQTKLNPTRPNKLELANQIEKKLLNSSFPLSFGKRKKCRIAKMSNRHFFLFLWSRKNVELEKILQFDIFVVKFEKGKNVELYILKGKNVELKF